MTRRKVAVSLVAGLVLVGGGVTVFNILKSFKPEPERSSFNRAPLAVRSLIAKKVDHRETVSGYGVVRSLARSVIAAEVDGVLLEIAPGALEGGVLRKDDLIARIDPALWEARRDAAQSRLDQAKINIEMTVRQARTLEERERAAREAHEAARREVERLRKLVDEGAMAGSQLDTQIERAANARSTWLALKQQLEDLHFSVASREADIRAASAELKQTETNLERTEIRAPFGGRVVKRHLDPGSRVAPGTPLVTLVDPGRLEIAVSIAARHAGAMPTETPAVVNRSSVDEQIDASVARISPEIDEMNRTLTIYLSPSADSGLIPGQTVRARIPGGLTANVIPVPRSAFLDRDCFVLRKRPDAPDYMVERRTPDVIAWLPDVALVGGGLEDGEHIAVTGINEIDHGAVVTLVEDPTPADQ